MKWRYAPPADTDDQFLTTLPAQFVADLLALLLDEHRKPRGNVSFLETVKSRFAEKAGEGYAPSSNSFFLRGDVSAALETLQRRAPLFLDALHEVLETFEDDIDLTVEDLNDMMEAYGIGYIISDRRLFLRKGVDGETIEEIAKVDNPLWNQAHSEVNDAWAKAQVEIVAHPTRAVQTIWWMLESVGNFYLGTKVDSTDLGDSYFNQVMAKLRKVEKDEFRRTFISALMKMHGFLSDPKSSIRHGRGPGARDWTTHEARLVVGVARVMANFLIEEYQHLEASGRLTPSGGANPDP